jgi:RHS repeat-associated protein
MMLLTVIQYVVNAVSHRTSVADSAETTSWSYDNLDRLTNVTYPNGDTVAYGYDEVGNHTSHTDALNRQTVYAYDALDRLTGISGPVTAGYAYNGDGLRVSKTVGGATTRYTWDVLGLPRVLADGNEYVWGYGLVAQVTGAGTATYAHVDGLGSVRVVTDDLGAVVGTRQYDAFGGTRAQSGVTLPFGYAGEQEDMESSLLYMRARYVDPSSGRFLSVDPLAGNTSDPVSQQRYSYARNSPVVYTDRTGLTANTTTFGSLQFGITSSHDLVPSCFTPNRFRLLASETVDCVFNCLKNDRLLRAVFGVGILLSAATCAVACVPLEEVYQVCFAGCMIGSIPRIAAASVLLLAWRTGQCYRRCT